MTQNQNLEAKVIGLIADQLHMNPQEITRASTLESIGADSLDRVELIMKFEEEFNIEISDVDAEKLVTVEDLIEYIQKLTDK